MSFLYRCCSIETNKQTKQPEMMQHAWWCRWCSLQSQQSGVRVTVQQNMCYSFNEMLSNTLPITNPTFCSCCNCFPWWWYFYYISHACSLNIVNLTDLISVLFYFYFYFIFLHNLLLFRFLKFVHIEAWEERWWVTDVIPLTSCRIHSIQGLLILICDQQN